MSYRDLRPFTLTFEAMLRTRELVRVVLQITTAGRGASFKASVFVPFLSLEGVEARIKERLKAEAQSATNLWAIAQASIEDAHAGYESLARPIMAIESADFTVTHVVVQEILPLTPKKEVPPPAPPPPQKKTRAEIVIGEMSDTIKALTELSHFQKECREKNPEIFDDEDVGELLLHRFDDHKKHIIDPDWRL